MEGLPVPGGSAAGSELKTLERLGARVLNGADVFALELSKSAQAALLRTLGIDTPWSVTFNDVPALGAYADAIRWPAVLKPDRGGSGARIHVVRSLSDVASIFDAEPAAWLPDNLFFASGGPGVYSNQIAIQLTPYDIKAAQTVYRSGLNPGASRAAFLDAGLINSTTSLRHHRVGDSMLTRDH